MTLPLGLRGSLVLLGIFVVPFVLPGCGKSYDPEGPGSYMYMKRSREAADKGLKSQGIGMSMKNYGLGQAWIIDASGKQISDQTIRHLTALERVTELNFSGSSLTDAQLKQLAAAKTDVFAFLMKLDLSGTAISDRSLPAVNHFPRLKELNLSKSQVTPQGIDRVVKERTTLTEIPEDSRTLQIQK